MHLHILGISGTFMSALAVLAREAGHVVTGCDAACYPPVSDLLRALGITWVEGYDDAELALSADQVIVGNAIKRGMPVIEAIMDAGIPYISGPQWLAENILPRYKVLAVAGTHGKTTTTSMLAFILHHAGLNPGFLIGGVASDFNTSACLGSGEWFVIEADEYDTAFFDKRPKFIHYRPQLAILNNLEFDHADIYENLSAIQQQFHYFLRTIPSKGMIIRPRDDKALTEVLQKGTYSQVETLALSGNASWCAVLQDHQCQEFSVLHHGKLVAKVRWSLMGQFNVENALAAIAASAYAGVNPQIAAEALAQFTPVKRRLEVKGVVHGVTVYDDFAHHPTAILKTIQALKQSALHKRVLVILEFASYTMRSGVHADSMAHALALADFAYILQPNFSLAAEVHGWLCPYSILPTVTDIVDTVLKSTTSGDALLIMSNRGFGDIHNQLLRGLQRRTTA